jgi:hypothetical protein
MALRTKHPIPIPPPAPVPLGKLLPVPFLTQLPQQEWCWAACGAMVLQYYGSTTVQQCTLANQQLGLTNCCVPPPVSSACDQPLDDPAITHLYPTNGMKRPHYHTTSIIEADLQNEINADRPVQLGWEMSGVGHTVLVVGWRPDPAGTIYRVHDPIRRAFRELAYPWLQGAGGEGSWTVTWTKLRK